MKVKVRATGQFLDEISLFNLGEPLHNNGQYHCLKSFDSERGAMDHLWHIASIVYADKPKYLKAAKMEIKASHSLTIYDAVATIEKA